ncbi:molybdopterin synthase sulfur carrier subunit [Alkalihalobacillus xiaoxiensis]|uniref:Molybdopterin synthase sulfur carrier subunit n=1 Tax=Shouchella xiaoxiensis TaxID=766895 RepID=A0ABS2T032_9BACI|nr:molybdopterin converting factor subunit 1 [Shouchella xiaoxiensis]MBM7841133.1 molybdopterin synthase sulfur carrier subunit [Shouchella xiaoxiensis]
MITILLFARMEEEVGSSKIEANVSGKTIADLKSWMQATYSLEKELTQCMTAINEEFATDADVIKENDVVAFIPPVSGG